MQWRDLVQVQTQTGDPIMVRGVRLRPQSQALTVRFGTWGGLVWNRPLAVLIGSDDDSERIPIVDVTRVAQVALLAATCMVVLIVSALGAGRRR